MKKILRFLLWILVGLIVIFGLTLGYFWVTEWTPKEIEVAEISGYASSPSVSDTLTIVAWNIGYAGLGDDMDFFYDGGETARTSESRTELNLRKIVDFLKQYDSVDFILLQEVDFDSKRSYNKNEYETIVAAMSGFESCYGYNYVSSYVPIPLNDPIGKVRSGLVTLSKHKIASAKRLQYPSKFDFPVRLFNLKRAMLSCQIILPNNDTLYVNNTHNTAYDTGGMRSQEIAFMNALLQGKPYSFTAGDWNCNPPGYTASDAEVNDKNFSPMALKTTDFSADMTFLADTTTPSTRYGYEPYINGHTTTTYLDFALLGKNIEPISVQTIDLGFKNSDHNPVVYRIAIKTK